LLSAWEGVQITKYWLFLRINSLIENKLFTATVLQPEKNVWKTWKEWTVLTPKTERNGRINTQKTAWTTQGELLIGWLA
jgi:hypothetical protein